MNPADITTVSALLLSGLVLAVLSVTGAAWFLLFDRWRQGLPAVPYWPRRPAPWGFFDVLLVFVLYFGVEILAVQTVDRWIPADLKKPPQAAKDEDADTIHPVIQMVEHGGIGIVLIAALLAVVVAPVVEEFLFRVLLQGWLEARERRLRRTQSPQWPLLPWSTLAFLKLMHWVLLRWRIVPLGAISILISAALFALMHAHGPTPQYNPTHLGLLLLAKAVANIAALILGVALLRSARGATAADLGWDPRYLAADIRLGLIGFAVIAVPIYMLQLAMMTLGRQFDVQFSVDPISLFPLALVLGYLYFRTHRAGPSVVLHMALNFTSLLMAILATAAK